VLYSAIHHCLLHKIRNQKFSASLKKSNVNFLLDVILFLWTKGFQTHLGICVNANVCVFGWTPESRLYVLRSLHGLPEQRCYLESPRLQQAKHATSEKPLVSWKWSAFKCSDTNVVFQRATFLILVLRNNKRSSDIDGKTSDCFSRNFWYYRYLELRFCF